MNKIEKYIYKDNFYYTKLTKEIKERITGKSYPKEFNLKYKKIDYEDLRYLKIKYYDFREIEHNDGEMIVNKNIAREVLEIFYKLYLNKYPINKIKLIDEYNANDELSMQDNNSSAFNYRFIENTKELSWHCFGLAIDINPLYNPYIKDGIIYPSNSKKYADRTKEFKGKIDYNDLAYILFTKKGWLWGGDFEGRKDYQHFYKELYSDDIRKNKNKYN